MINSDPICTGIYAECKMEHGKGWVLTILLASWLVSVIMEIPLVDIDLLFRCTYKKTINNLLKF